MWEMRLLGSNESERDRSRQLLQERTTADDVPGNGDVVADQRGNTVLATDAGMARLRGRRVEG